MEHTKTLDLPRVGWEAYRKSCGGVAINGDTLPDWEDMRPDIKNHWQYVASAIMVEIYADLLKREHEDRAAEE